MKKIPVSLILAVLVLPFFILAQFSPPGGGGGGGGGGGSPSRSLNVTKTGVGAGTITDNSVPQKINCGAICSASYDDGSSVTLTASASDGSIFESWGGDCASAGSSPNCSLTMNADKSVTVTFNSSGGGGGGGGMQTQLSVKIEGNGSGSVASEPSGISCNSGTCTANFSIGTNVKLTATPSENSNVSGWGGDCVSSGRICDIMMTTNRNASVNFGAVGGGGGGGSDFDYYFLDPFDSFTQQIKKRKFYTVPWYLDRLVNIGKMPFTGDIRTARWRVDAEGKLRGSLAHGNVLIDLISGYSQISFRGGRKGLTGLIAYYAFGISNITELIDATHQRIYTNEKLISIDGEPIELTLLFNGPMEQPTLFGTMTDSKQRERFFITTPSLARSVSIHPLINKVPLQVPFARLKFSPPAEILKSFFKGLGVPEAQAASLSFSQLLRLRGELIALQSDVALVDQIAYDHDRAKETVLQTLRNSGRADLLEAYQRGQINLWDLTYETAFLGLLDFYNTDQGLDILNQFSEEDILELKKWVQPQKDKIQEYKAKLDKLNVLNRPPADNWLTINEEAAIPLAEGLGISKSLAHFLILEELPRPFVVTILKDDEVIMARCESQNSTCEKSFVNPAAEKFVNQEAANYEAVINSYRAIDEEKVQPELFSAFY